MALSRRQMLAGSVASLALFDKTPIRVGAAQASDDFTELTIKKVPAVILEGGKESRL